MTKHGENFWHATWMFTRMHKKIMLRLKKYCFGFLMWASYMVFWKCVPESFLSDTQISDKSLAVRNTYLNNTYTKEINFWLTVKRTFNLQRARRATAVTLSVLIKVLQFAFISTGNRAEGKTHMDYYCPKISHKRNNSGNTFCWYFRSLKKSESKHKLKKHAYSQAGIIAYMKFNNCRGNSFFLHKIAFHILKRCFNASLWLVSPNTCFKLNCSR